MTFMTDKTPPPVNLDPVDLPERRRRARSAEGFADEVPTTGSTSGAALAAWDASWDRDVRAAFLGFDVDRTRIRRVRTLLPGAVRGLHDEQYLSSYADILDARRGLAEAITGYLS